MTQIINPNRSTKVLLIHYALLKLVVFWCCMITHIFSLIPCKVQVLSIHKSRLPSFPEIVLNRLLSISLGRCYFSIDKLLISVH